MVSEKRSWIVSGYESGTVEEWGRAGGRELVEDGDLVVRCCEEIEKVIGTFGARVEENEGVKKLKLEEREIPEVDILVSELLPYLKCKDRVPLSEGGRKLLGVMPVSNRDFGLIERVIKDSNSKERMIDPMSDEVVEEFYDKVSEIAYALSKKYWQVSGIYPVEDVIQEVVLRVASRKIMYDPTKSKMSTFVYMIVNSTYMNIAKSKVVVDSFSKVFIDDVVGEDGREVVEIIPDRRSQEFEDIVAMKDMMNRVDEEIVVKAMKLKCAGYSNVEIGRGSGKLIGRGREILAREYGYSF